MTYNAPSTLNTELHAKGASCETAESIWKDPDWDEC